MNATPASSSQSLTQAAPGMLVDSLPEAVVLIDSREAIDYANPAAGQLFGCPVSELEGRSFPALLAPPFQEDYAEALREYSQTGQSSLLGVRREVVGSHRDGSNLVIELILSEAGGSEGRALVAVLRDIREYKLAEAKLQHRADHDALTGLLNRASFEQVLTQVEFAAGYEDAGAVIAVGIDNFKYINESVGHEGGDQLLKETAQLIRGRLRKSDVVARIGGDVFGALLREAGADRARAIADELLEIVRRHPFAISGQAVRISLSAGVTSLEGRPVTGTELLAEADLAMYSAKDAGRDRVSVYEHDGRDDTESKRVWSERVRHATERGLFVLVSQPIVDLRQEEVTQHEILLRMRGDQGELIEPGAFLATAERFGLIGGVDRWVTQQAVRMIEAHARDGSELTLEVNLSGKTLGDPRFPDEVRRELRSSGIDPARLIFEVTETAAVADVEQARRFARGLTELGTRFALDDFGAGYASFYYLKHLPIGYLKIDGEFVRELPSSRVDQLIIKGLVDVCAGLGIKTVAEFVEDQRTMDMVRELGVDFAQGYFLGKPEPVAALRAPAGG
jgi:diguanylate cyclase (GGDEF)-like protein/PAS domain S-box-containing protein